MSRSQNKFIIIRSDGGICSQISFHALGRYFENKGFKVKYDLSWFKENGKDLNGIFARNFDMQKAFPSLAVEEASPEEIAKYKKKYAVKEQALDTIVPPAYYGIYEERNRQFLLQHEEFAKHFDPVDKAEIAGLLAQIQQTDACGIHVRRGDLATTDVVYGKPTDVSYFIKAIKIISALRPGSVFYFFSDEPEWVAQNIIPELDKNISCQICTQNGSDKGYLDLYLLSRCKSIISSQGSFGIFARLLSPENPLLIISRPRQRVINNLGNVIFINETPFAPEKDIPGIRPKIKIKDSIRLKLYKYLQKKLEAKGLI